MRKESIKENTGNELLIPKCQWVDKLEIQGGETKTLTHPIMEQAFQQVLKQHEPKHSVCLVSPCTITRPYGKSRKWSRFVKLFGDTADLVVCSSGGVIPMEFWESYPYQTYNSKNEGVKTKGLYIRTVYRRLTEFFDTFHYDKIVFDFLPSQLNRAVALKMKQERNENIIVVPTLYRNDRAREENYKPVGKRYPDLSDAILSQIIEAVTSE